MSAEPVVVFKKRAVDMSDLQREFRAFVVGFSAGMVGLLLAMPLLPTLDSRPFAGFSFGTIWGAASAAAIGASAASAWALLRPAAGEHKPVSPTVAALVGAALLVAADLASDAIGLGLAGGEDQGADFVVRSFLAAVALSVVPFLISRGRGPIFLGILRAVLCGWIGGAVMYQLVAVCFLAVAAFTLGTNASAAAIQRAGFVSTAMWCALDCGWCGACALAAVRLRQQAMLRFEDGSWLGRDEPLIGPVCASSSPGSAGFVQLSTRGRGRWQAECFGCAATINGRPFQAQHLVSGDVMQAGRTRAVFLAPVRLGEGWVV